MILLASAAICGAGCRSDGEGARIAAPAEGPWIWMCAAEVAGPDRPARTGQSETRQGTRRKARRTAIAAACKAAGAGAACSSQAGGWTLSKDVCERETGQESDTPEYRCRITVLRPGGARRQRTQGEARTAKKACERAVRQACRDLGGDAACIQGRDGWSIGTSVGRRRP